MRISLPTGPVSFLVRRQWLQIDPQKQMSITAARPRRILTDFPFAPVERKHDNAMKSDCK
jgi:hypothetical protein